MTAGGEGLTVPFTAERAEWIRSNVWTPAMRKEYREVPGFRTTCPCQWAATSHCRNDQCGRCHRATPQRAAATVICRRGGMEEAHFPEPYEHVTDTSATGPRYETAAMVWLADRVCRWVCDHDCHTAPAAPVKPVQLDLFGEAA